LGAAVNLTLCHAGVLDINEMYVLIPYQPYGMFLLCGLFSV
jgi:hypothetical protein